jgi:hypothetical protein
MPLIEVAAVLIVSTLHLLLIFDAARGRRRTSTDRSDRKLKIGVAAAYIGALALAALTGVLRW